MQGCRIGAALLLAAALHVLTLPARAGEDHFSKTFPLKDATLSAPLFPFTLAGQPSDSLEPVNSTRSTTSMGANLIETEQKHFQLPAYGTVLTTEAQYASEPSTHAFSVSFNSRASAPVQVELEKQRWQALRIAGENSNIRRAYLLSPTPPGSSQPQEMTAQEAAWTQAAGSQIALAVMLGEEGREPFTIAACFAMPGSFLSPALQMRWVRTDASICVQFRHKAGVWELRPNRTETFQWHARTKHGHDLAWAEAVCRRFAETIPNEWDRHENADD